MEDGEFSWGPDFKEPPSKEVEKPEPKPIVISAEKTTAETRIQPIGPEEIITDSTKIQEMVNEDKKTGIELLGKSEAGSTSPIVINYPSGLRLILWPVFDGQPSIESFTGFFRVSLAFSPQYHINQDYNWTEVDNQKAIPEGFTEVPIKMSLAIEHAFPFEEKVIRGETRLLNYRVSQMGRIPNEEILFVLSKDFYAAYGKKGSETIRLVGLSLDQLKLSEQSIAAIFHELGHHSLFGKVEQILIQVALHQANVFRKEVADFPFTVIPDGEKSLFDAIAKDLAPEVDVLVQTLEPLKDKILENPPKKLEDLVKILMGDEQGRKVLTLFHERTAWAKARMMMRWLSEKHQASFQFNQKDDKKLTISSQKLGDFQRACLETYAKAFDDPRFLRGFR
jgi:hypothetical protein